MADSSQKLMNEALSRLQSEDISTIPAILFEILLMSQDPNADADDVANICKQDISSSTRLLRAANSICFGRRLDQPRVESLKDAVIRLGFKRSQEIVMSASLSPIMRDCGSIMDYSASRLWKHSIAVAIGNRLIYTHKFGTGGTLDPYLSGLLHDLGIAIEHQTLLDHGFGRAILQRYRNDSNLPDEERLAMGFSHEDIGATAARQWNLPEYLIDLISHHHSFDTTDSQSADLLHINRVSEWMCYYLNLGYSDFSRPSAAHLAHSRERLNLSSADIQELSSRLKAEMESFVGMNWFEPINRHVA